MAVTITGIGPTVLRTFTFPDASAKILTNAAQVLVSEGGTGAASLSAHGVIVGEGTSAVAVVGPDATVGKPLLSAGASADPAFGDLGVAHGGTGATTLAAHGVVVGNGTGAVAVTGAGTAGQAFRSNGASVDPSFGEIVQTTTSTGTVNDFALTAGASVLRCNNATLLTLTGIAAGFDGQRLVIVSVGAGQVDLSHQDAGSTTAGDRLILFATSGKTSLAAGVGTAEVEYDASTARWRLVAHNQGDYIEYGGTSTIVGWSSRTTTVVRYYLLGRQLAVLFDLEGTSNATTSTFTVPYTASIAGQCGNLQVVNAGAVTTTPGLAQTTASSAVVSTYKDYSGAAWSATLGKNATGAITYQVQ